MHSLQYLPGGNSFDGSVKQLDFALQSDSKHN